MFLGSPWSPFLGMLQLSPDEEEEPVVVEEEDPEEKAGLALEGSEVPPRKEAPKAKDGLPKSEAAAEAKENTAAQAKDESAAKPGVKDAAKPGEKIATEPKEEDAAKSESASKVEL